jgi:hypothetical protein
MGFGRVTAKEPYFPVAYGDFLISRKLLHHWLKCAVAVEGTSMAGAGWPRHRVWLA